MQDPQAKGGLIYKTEVERLLRIEISHVESTN